MTTVRHSSPFPWVHYNTEEEIDFTAIFFRTPQPLSFCLWADWSQCNKIPATRTTNYIDKPRLTLISEAGWHAGTVCKQFLCDFGIFEWSWKNFPWNRQQNLLLLFFELPDYLARELLKRGYENSWKRASTRLLQSIEQLAPTVAVMWKHASGIWTRTSYGSCSAVRAEESSYLLREI